MSNVPSRSTKLTFQNWQRKENSNDLQRTGERALPCRQHAKKHMIVCRRSKFGFVFSSTTDLISRYPQIRPSICSVLTGSSFLIVGILFLAIPQIRTSIPIWVGSMLTIAGGIGVLAGLVGFVRQSMKLQRSASVCYTSIIQNHSWESPVLKAVVEVRERSCSGETPPKGNTARRKLPESPLDHCKGNTTIDRKLDKSQRVKTFYSSEPDLHLDGCKRDFPYKPKPHQVTRYEHFEQINFVPHGSKNDVIKDEEDSAKPCAGNAIFDRFHDPLLFRAITRIKYQCDCEFHLGKMNRCDVNNRLRHHCNVERKRHFSESIFSENEMRNNHIL